MKKQWTHIDTAGIAIGLAIYAAMTWALNYIHDNAFITFRYVANFGRGEGLVYNAGEFVEGMSNHGWAIALSVLDRIGIDYVVSAQLMGWLAGVVLLIVTLMTAGTASRKSSSADCIFPVLIVAATPSLALWAASGMESALFVLVVTGALMSWLRRGRLLGWMLSVAFWLHPTGAVAALLIILSEAIVDRRISRHTLGHLGLMVLAAIPLVMFKSLYYGDILPNPYYSKIGITLQQVTYGLDYAWQFIRDYPMLVLPLLMGVVFYPQLTRHQKTLLVFAWLYALFVVVIGGDVLAVHRLFLTIIPILAILLLSITRTIISGLAGRIQTPAVVTIGVVTLLLGATLPFPFAREYRYDEIVLNAKMAFLGEKLVEADQSQFSVAASNVGVLGYTLIDHRMIDIVGLTDTVISRHPRVNVPALESDIRQRTYNAAYVLQQRPDYIVFATGTKPSTPGEIALLTYRDFVNAYRIVSWEYRATATARPVMTGAYKRMRPVEGPFVSTYPVEYARLFIDGIEYTAKRQLDSAIAVFDSAIALSPRPILPYLLYRKSYAHGLKGEFNVSRVILNSILDRDSMVAEAHADLFKYATLNGDTAKANIHRQWIQTLVPWQERHLENFEDRAP